MSPPVFRFAPSPNGALHLGHAYSALLNHEMASANGGRMLVRVEDIDLARCTPEFERDMLEDLDWLGIGYERPVRRQSDHLSDYAAALDVLADAGLVYPSWLSRGDIRRMALGVEERGGEWPRDPDGAYLHPGRDHEGETGDGPCNWRLDMKAAVSHAGRALVFSETGLQAGDRVADPLRWGDVVLARKDAPTSYHMAVVVDDALQGITHVVRGADLAAATDVHVLLQALLGLPQPVYHHHVLITDDDGRKLSKSDGDTSIASLRDAGMTPEDVRRLVGL